MKTRTLDQLTRQLQKKYTGIASWRTVAVACKVLTADGRPNPGLAQRIAKKGYEPKRFETRIRLGLAPICVTCGQKVKRVRHVPTWLDEAVANLQKLEAEANVPLEEKRIYSRGKARTCYAGYPRF